MDFWLTLLASYLAVALVPIVIALIRRAPWPGWLALWCIASTATGIGWLGAMLYACLASPLESEWTEEDWLEDC